MDESKQLTLFDYESLDLDTRSFVQTKTAEIRILVKQTAQGIIEIGQRLIEVRERLEHGQFLGWIETETGIGKSTAYNFMSVAEKFPTGGSLDFSPKVLYLLASPSTPDEACTEAITRSEAGEKITHIKARELIEAHKQIEQQRQMIEDLHAQRDGALIERDRLEGEKAKVEQIVPSQDTHRMLIEQDRQIEELNAQVEAKNTQIATFEAKIEALLNREPEVIEKEVERIVEKVVEIIPDDYEQVKVDREKLKDQLEKTKGKLVKTKEDSEYKTRQIQDLENRIERKNKELDSYDYRKCESKALGLFIQAHNAIIKAISYLNVEGRTRSTDQINRYISSIKGELSNFSNIDKIIDLGVVNE